MWNITITIMVTKLRQQGETMTKPNPFKINNNNNLLQQLLVVGQVGENAAKPAMVMELREEPVTIHRPNTEAALV